MQQEDRRLGSVSQGDAVTYVRGADGVMHEEIREPGGGLRYQPAPKGLSFREMPGGKFMAVRDTAEAARQREYTWPERFVGQPMEDGKHLRQRLKRIDAFESQLTQVVLDRVAPGAGPKVEQVTDEKFLDLHNSYQAAVAKKEGHLCDFQPLSTYQHKLTTSSGKTIRPIFKGEVGVRPNGTIVVLEEGYGTGNLVAVPR